MSKWAKSLILLSGICSLNTMAAVDVALGDNVDLVAFNGEAVGIRVTPLKSLELENGINQIAVKVSKLVTDPQGQYEKFNSEISIITFEAQDQTVDVKILADIKTRNDAETFNSKPVYDIKSNKNMQSQQDILAKGPGFTRDYEKEIIRYNQKRNIELNSIVIDTPFSAPVVNSKQNETPPVNIGVSELKSNFSQLNAAQKKEFLMWAVSQ